MLFTITQPLVREPEFTWFQKSAYKLLPQAKQGERNKIKSKIVFFENCCYLREL